MKIHYKKPNGDYACGVSIGVWTVTKTGVTCRICKDVIKRTESERSEEQ